MILFSSKLQAKYDSYIGKIFGKLIVLEVIDKYWDGKYYMPIMLCKCSCGKSSKVILSNLKSGNSKSCVCLRNECNLKRSIKHNMTHTKVYRAYQDASRRCNNKNIKNFHRYGGRGIKFLFNSFEEWYKELGDPPTKLHTVDRKDNDGHYEVGNVRWATRSEQAFNRSTTINIK